MYPPYSKFEKSIHTPPKGKFKSGGSRFEDSKDVKEIFKFEDDEDSKM